MISVVIPSSTRPRFSAAASYLADQSEPAEVIVMTAGMPLLGIDSFDVLSAPKFESLAPL